MKVRTEVAITGNEPPRADVAIDGHGGIVWTITAHGRRVVLELSADEAVRLVVPVLMAAGASSFAAEQAQAAARLAVAASNGKVPQ